MSARSYTQILRLCTLYVTLSSTVTGDQLEVIIFTKHIADSESMKRFFNILALALVFSLFDGTQAMTKVTYLLKQLFSKI